MNIEQSIKAIQAFKGQSLTEKISDIEGKIIGKNAYALGEFCNDICVNNDFISSARAIKKVAAQIYMVIHTSGILLSLPKILKDGEEVESVSLGAGNTGRKFDLETNYRIAEFKFIDWKGGDKDAAREDDIFKDFYKLAEYRTKKKKMLYVIDTTHPLKFLNGGRKIEKILSKQPEILASINEKYGDEVKVARDYYNLHKDSVSIIDIRPHIGIDI